MADLGLFQSFRITLTKHEFLLVTKALAGRLVKSEVEEAKTLGDMLAAQRVKMIEQMAEENQRLKANLVEAGVDMEGAQRDGNQRPE